MRNEVIYKGLRLVTNKCRYFKVVEGTAPSIVEDDITSTLTLTYSPGSSAKSLSVSLGVELVGAGHTMMEPTSGAIRFKKVYISLNGLKLEKLTYDSHIINIVIVSDSKSRVIQNYKKTIFVVSKKDYDNYEFIKYLFYSGKLLYLRPVGPQIGGDYVLRNFPKLLVGNRDLELTSNNDMIYTLRKRYDDYLIREIDYQDQFILEIRRLLDNYGVELVRFNKEQTLSTTSYVTYQFNQTPTRYNPMNARKSGEENIIGHKQPVEFVFHTPDMVMYHDFKNKYSNVFLLTNFTEFKTTDRAGDRWSAAIKWGPITEDFNHMYQADDNSNFSLQCQFRCEIYFYEVLDTRYEFLSEIVMEIDAEEVDGERVTKEEQVIT